MTVHSLVPRPTSVSARSGRLLIGREATLATTAGAEAVEPLVREVIGRSTGFALCRGGEQATFGLAIDRHLGRLGPEGYRLVVDEQGVRLSASATAGLRNAVQTLRQVMGPKIYATSPEPGAIWSLPCVEIEDRPRFAWRGAHLDVSRHFMPASFLLRFVDLLAMHKLNVFHLHLTDDQGWRFPSRAYPRLTEVGAWRRESLLGHKGSGRFDGTPHGGAYRREQLAELVAFAAERNVTVVPEIDLPGHTQSAIAAYPELGNLDEQLEVWTGWGVSDHVLNAEPATLRFCETLLQELLEVFPSRHVHLGGDECPTAEWGTSSRARVRAAALGLGEAAELQGWFTSELCGFLRAAGRVPVGWDEILETGAVPAGAVVMSWRGVGGGVAAAKAGLDTVMCPERPCYLDHYQSDGPEEPLAIGGCNTLEDVYAYEPVPDDLDPVAAAHVLGSQVQLWTEYMPTAAGVEYMAFPRAAAFAEVVWSTGTRDIEELRQRLPAHLERLDVMDVNYRPLDGPRPWQAGGTGPRRRTPPRGQSADPATDRAAEGARN